MPHQHDDRIDDLFLQTEVNLEFPLIADEKVLVDGVEQPQRVYDNPPHKRPLSQSHHEKRDK